MIHPWGRTLWIAAARQHVLEGAVTAGYEADRERVVALLNEALATELADLPATLDPTRPAPSFEPEPRPGT